MQKIFSGSSKPRAFLKQLSILLNAGVPLAKAIDFDGKMSTMAEKIRSGSSFSDSLDPSAFPPSAVAMIRVGERSGNLAEGIARACEHMEKGNSFRKKLIGSLIYPAFVLSLCAAAIIILTSVLLPSFSGIFGSLGVSLPPLSRFIMTLAGQMPLVLVLVSVSLGLTTKYLISDRGLKFPVIGHFRKKLMLASYFRAMAESLTAGMNIIDSLELAASVVGSKLYRDKLLSVSASVTDGQALSEAFKLGGSFDETVLSLVSAGEQASSLDKVFGQLAALYEEEIENSLKTFSSLVEPAATLATGLVVGIIVFAMFLPIIKLISVLGG
jgi:type IV pilus assembly protein PilC